MKKVFDKEMRKLATLNQQSADYSVQLNYLQTIVSLPWNEFTTDDLSLQRAAASSTATTTAWRRSRSAFSNT